MPKKTYKRISNVDDTTQQQERQQQETTTTSSESNRMKPIQEKISEKIHALFFISLSFLTIKYTDTIDLLLTSNDIIRPLLYISITLIAINTVLFLYLGIYIPKIKGINAEEFGSTNSELWSIYCPRVIPMMTFNGVFCGIFLMRCFWPVWGFLTPFILGIEWFGLIFVSQFIPWC